MKKALILGISGSFGSHLARALSAQGYALTALVREPANIKTEHPGVHLVKGNVADRQALRTAAADHDIMVYAVNPANYDWQDKAVPWLDNAAAVAEEFNMTLLFPGNVYIYDPADGPDFTEQSRACPKTDKGHTRQRMEQRLALAAEQGAQVIIIRAGDFIAADAKTSWLNRLIVKKANSYKLTLPGRADIKHTWAYLPDVAVSAVNLLENRHRLDAFSVHHFAGYQLSFDEMMTQIEQLTGKKVTQTSFPWWVIRLCSPFSVLMQGLLEMRYLWNNEVNLKNDRPDQFILTTSQTPLATALQRAGII
ncbi:MAG: NAD(P)H-binding protein [Gammaproteobacteria bacterium]|nr:NAD(P)H-binding protein [Gammaproteobacteria bacterium]MDH5650394.1 NAD(P)H-binding protein [Gammaproteobacteria bacterium]